MLSTEFATKHPTMHKQPRERERERESEGGGGGGPARDREPGAPKSTQFVGAVAVNEENL